METSSLHSDYVIDMKLQMFFIREDQVLQNIYTDHYHVRYQLMNIIRRLLIAKRCACVCVWGGGGGGGGKKK